MAAIRTATRGKKAAAKPAPAPEPEEELETEELDEEEFEEVAEDEATDAPAKKAGKGSANDVTFGVAHLASHLSDKTGKTVTTRELRTLIRKMARDESGRVDREIVAGNRTRYDWPDGLKHPEVKAIIAAYTSGEGEIEKKEKLAALKAKGAAKKAAATPAKATAKKAIKKAAAAPVVEEDAEDDEELDFDED